MNKQELNKKLIEFAGFRLIDKTSVPYYVAPNGSTITRSSNMPHFTQSPDAFFKYLKPEINKRGFNILIYQVKKGWCVNFLWLEDTGMKRRQRVTNDKYESVDKELAIALCMATEKLIDSEK